MDITDFEILKGRDLNRELLIWTLTAELERPSSGIGSYCDLTRETSSFLRPPPIRKKFLPEALFM